MVPKYGVVVDVAERIRARGADLTAAERRIAEVILQTPQSIGFGTVAELAQSANVGAASVVRLATKLGFDGYTELQQAIQGELLQQLRPAAERIRTAGGHTRDEHTDTEVSNVQATLDGVEATAFEALVGRLALLDRPVAVLASEASRGVATQFTSQLRQLRPSVDLVGGDEVTVHRELALLDERATVLVVDLRRYERWVLEAHAAVAARGLWSAGVTDSMLSPIASRADVAFVVAASSSGPFDSFVGVLALLNLVASETAARLKGSATERLAAIEAAWTSQASLTTGE